MPTEAGKTSYEAAIEKLPPCYQPMGQVGRGGMAVVIKAVDTRTDSTVAIKFLNVDTRKHYRGMRRFRKELKICREIDHPNIIRILDGECTPERCYLVMEFLENAKDLRSLLRRSAFSVGDSLHVIVQVAHALSFLHQAGLVHRDIKPANIMVDGMLDAKVMDFGLVKILGRKGSTQTGALVGTPRYLAPEVILGDEATSAVDIYATGLLLYEMLTGQRPFPQDQMRTLLKAIVQSDFPPLPDLRPDLPRSLHDMVARCTARSPSQRYHSIDLFLVELRQHVVTGGLSILPVTEPILKAALGEMPA